MYAQQRTFLLAQQDERCPRTAFTEALAAEISRDISAGDNMVLMLDSNDSMTNSTLSQTLRNLQL